MDKKTLFTVACIVGVPVVIIMLAMVIPMIFAFI